MQSLYFSVFFLLLLVICVCLLNISSLCMRMLTVLPIQLLIRLWLFVLRNLRGWRVCTWLHGISLYTIYNNKNRGLGLYWVKHFCNFKWVCIMWSWVCRMGKACTSYFTTVMSFILKNTTIASLQCLNF